MSIAHRRLKQQQQQQNKIQILVLLKFNDIIKKDLFKDFQSGAQEIIPKSKNVSIMS